MPFRKPLETFFSRDLLLSFASVTTLLSLASFCVSTIHLPSPSRSGTLPFPVSFFSFLSVFAFHFTHIFVNLVFPDCNTDPRSFSLPLLLLSLSFAFASL